MLESLREAPLQLTLGNNETDEALLIRGRLLVPDVSRVLDLTQAPGYLDAPAVR